MMSFLLAAAALIAVPLALPVLRDTTLPRAKRRGLTAILIVAIIGGGMGLYTLLGAAAWVDAIDTQRTRQEKLRAEITRLQEQSHTAPDDAQNWRQLGAAWLEAGDATQAVLPLRRAVLASGGQPDIIAEYAAALVMNNNGVVNEDALASIAMALKLDPEQQLARKLEALWHEQQAAAAPQKQE